MVTERTRREIEDIIDDMIKEYSAALSEQAVELSNEIVNDTIEYLKSKNPDKFTRIVDHGITDQMIKEYQSGYIRGGSPCIERVINETDTPGVYKVYTRRRFIPWLDDMKETEVNEILQIISDGEKSGVHPRKIAKQLKDYFENTKHRPVTAARTEAAKIRNDARINTFRDAGVQYVVYITAGDERVRPDHAARDGMIYPIGKAPYIGEYNCRCVLSDADYDVEVKKLPVSDSHVVYLTEEELFGET